MTDCPHCRQEIPRSARRAPSGLTEGEALGVPCTTCGAGDGEPCDFSYHTWRLLGLLVEGAPGVHAARYALGMRVKAARGRRAERMAA